MAALHLNDLILGPAANKPRPERFVVTSEPGQERCASCGGTKYLFWNGRYITCMDCAKGSRRQREVTQQFRKMVKVRANGKLVVLPKEEDRLVLGSRLLIPGSMTHIKWMEVVNARH